MPRKFNFRLRKIDVDLEAAMAHMDQKAISDLCRDGLRMALGLRTTRRIEVTECPLFAPNALPLKGKPAVFVPQKKR